MWPSLQDSRRRHGDRATGGAVASATPMAQQSRRRTIEDVWNDITHGGGHDHHHHHHHRRPITPTVSAEHDHNSHHLHLPTVTSAPSIRGMMLQDFLAARAFKESSSAAQSVPFMPPPPTTLSLKSGVVELHHNCYHNCSGLQPCYAASSSSPSNSGSPHGESFVPPVFSPPTAGLFSYCPKNRMAESPDSGGDGDRRHKRMIKNRESAARSRARKQAYTNELQLEVAHLGEENDRLKKQCEELRLAMADQLHTKKTLRRISSALF